MRKKDFAADIQVVSANVATDMGAMMKLVREEQTRQGSPSEPCAAPSFVDPAAGTKARTSAPTDGRGKPPKVQPFLGRPKAPAPIAPRLREKVTLQLSPETNERLTEAALRQKLKKEHPDTRQAVVEVALREWFRRYGYDN